MTKNEQETNPLSIVAGWGEMQVIGNSDVKVVMPNSEGITPASRPNPPPTQQPPIPTENAAHAERRAPKAVPWWRPTSERAFRVIEVAGAMIGVVALIYAAEQSSLARRAFEDQRQTAAWQILSTPGFGTTGKGHALTALIELKVPMVNLRLDCAESEEAKDQCRNGVYLGNTSYDGGEEGHRIMHSSFVGANFAEASFRNFKFEGFDMRNTDFSGSTFAEAMFAIGTLGGAKLDRVKFQGMKLMSVDMTGAWISGSDFSGLDVVETQAISTEGIDVGYDGGITPAIIGSINVSGVQFCRVEACSGLTQEMIRNFWFYADNPPSFYGDGWDGLVIRGGCTLGGANKTADLVLEWGGMYDTQMPDACISEEAVPLTSLQRAPDVRIVHMYQE